jgi:hypothetical protein
MSLVIWLKNVMIKYMSFFKQDGTNWETSTSEIWNRWFNKQG